jgi:NADPH2:quinone reductase
MRRCKHNVICRPCYELTVYREPDAIAPVWNGIYDLIAAGTFKGTCFTDEEFVGLERVPAALKALGARETWGKVVVKIPQEAQSKL